MKKLIAHDVIIVASGCSAQAAARAGLMDKRAKDLCGAGLKRVCELADIPPVLHMGSCVDISRMMVLVAELAKMVMSIFPSFRLSDVLRSGCLRKQFPSETML